jgi:proteasome lid subunit RPN8/RPN11
VAIERVHLTRRAWAEDIEYLRLDESPNIGLEVSAGLFGWIEEGKRIVVAEIRRNIFVTPDSPVSCQVDVEAWMIYDRTGARLIGDLHTHPEDDRRASQADKETWRDAAHQLGHPFAGLVLTRRQDWEAGFPVMSWFQPQIDAWITDPSGASREAYVTIEPKWLADLEASVRFRPESAEANA